jgi:hypothetical protein
METNSAVPEIEYQHHAAESEDDEAGLDRLEESPSRKIMA